MDEDVRTVAVDRDLSHVVRRLTVGQRRLGLGVAFVLGLLLEWVIIIRHWHPCWYLVCALIWAVAGMVFGLGYDHD